MLFNYPLILTVFLSASSSILLPAWSAPIPENGQVQEPYTVLAARAITIDPSQQPNILSGSRSGMKVKRVFTPSFLMKRPKNDILDRVLPQVKKDQAEEAETKAKAKAEAEAKALAEAGAPAEAEAPAAAAAAAANVKPWGKLKSVAGRFKLLRPNRSKHQTSTGKGTGPVGAGTRLELEPL